MSANFRQHASRLLSWLTMLVPALIVLEGRVANLIILVLAVIGAYQFARNETWKGLSRDQRRLIYAILLVVGLACLSFAIIHSYDGWRQLGRTARLLIFPLLLIGIISLRIPRVTLWLGFFVAAGAVGVYSVWQLLGAHYHWWTRLHGDVSALTFGQMSVFFSFTGVMAYPWLQQANRRLAYLAVIICLAAGLWAALLAQSRGAWIAVPIFTILASLATRPGRRLKGFGVIVGLLSLAIVGTLLWKHNPLTDRVQKARTDVHALRNLEEMSSTSQTVGNCGPSKSYMEEIERRLVLRQGITAHLRSFAGKPSIVNGCQLNYALHFMAGGKTAAYALLTHIRFAFPEKGQSIEFYSRGEAILRWPKYRDFKRQIIKSTGFALHEIPAAPGKTVLEIIVKKGDDFEFVPVVTHWYEYAAALTTSTGARLQMWKAAWIMFLKHPFMGVGLGNIAESALPLAKKGLISPVPTYYDHSHSIYFTALAQQGIVGIVSLVLLLLVPFAYFARQFRSEGSPERRAAALAGIYLVTGFSIFGLTEAVFNHSSVITFYMFCVAIFSAACEPFGHELSSGLDQRNREGGRNQSDLT